MSFYAKCQSSWQLSFEQALFHEPADGLSPQSPLALDTVSFPIFRVQLVREGQKTLSKHIAVQSPKDVAEVFVDYLQDADREHFAILLLDTKNHILGLHTVSIGILNSALVSPREVFKAAILANAASIVLAHNHPSGDPTPSLEDQRVTEKLQQAGEILDIEVLDHIVVGEEGSFQSLKERGMM